MLYIDIDGMIHTQNGHRCIQKVCDGICL